MENIIRLEAKLENMDKMLCQVLEELKTIKSEMIVYRDKSFQLHVRVEQLEKTVAHHGVALQGNVTTKVLKHWVIGTAAVVSSLMVVFNLLLKLSR